MKTDTLPSGFVKIEHEVTIGRVKSLQAYRKALHQAKICSLTCGANQLLKSLTISSPARDVRLGHISARNLGLPDRIRLNEVHDAGRANGLRLCTPEMVVALRLVYLDQPRGEWVATAMPAVQAPNLLSPEILTFGCDQEGGLHLRTHEGHADSYWDHESLFLFEYT